MNAPGDLRRAADGTFEYLHRQSITTRKGLVEEWEPAATHAARNMLMPDPFLENLRSHGYDGGPTLYDLLISEGWRPPERDYLEIQRSQSEIGVTHEIEKEKT